MTLVRLGYVAMSVNLEKCSPSQTMTYTQFSKFDDKRVALNKLEKIAKSNLANCLRLLQHNLAHDISFFRLSSKLVPLATHEAIKGWNYLEAISGGFEKIKEFLVKNPMRIDFHPDHFVLLNSPKEEVLEQSLKTLEYHRALLQGMGLDPTHRCIIHVGGKYKNIDESLERFIANWRKIPHKIQQLILLENDDKSFNLQDTLFLCEKLEIPLVFDYHHYLALNNGGLEEDWKRVIKTWDRSQLPVKIHISSPKSAKEFRHHADYINAETFLSFLNLVKGSTKQIDCMIEAKRKDEALLKLVSDFKKYSELKFIDETNFVLN